MYQKQDHSAYAYLVDDLLTLWGEMKVNLLVEKLKGFQLNNKMLITSNKSKEWVIMKWERSNLKESNANKIEDTIKISSIPVTDIRCN